MRRMTVLVLVAALAMLALAGCSAPAAGGSGSSGGASGGSTGGATGAAKAAAVEMKEFAFQPATVEIAVGGTVTWTNADSATHTVKGDGWASGDLAQGATFSHAFDTAGTFAYSCGIHPSMTGEVIVK
jgi:plastocyanin